MKSFWTETAIPRWQLMLAYLGIVVAMAFSLANTRNAIVQSCQDQNQRNRATKASLIAAAAKDIEKAEANARARQQNPELFKNEIEGRRDVTLALIDALAPVEDCDSLFGIF